jgi:hypothetical protein
VKRDKKGEKSKCRECEEGWVMCVENDKEEKEVKGRKERGMYKTFE